MSAMETGGSTTGAATSGAEGADWEVGAGDAGDGRDAGAGVVEGATAAKEEGGRWSPMSAGTRGERTSSFCWDAHGLRFESPKARLEEKEEEVKVLLEMGWLRRWTREMV